MGKRLDGEASPWRGHDRLAAPDAFGDLAGMAAGGSSPLVETVRRCLDFVPLPLLLSTGEGPPAGCRGHRLLHVNKAFLEQIGYSLEEMPYMEDWLRLALPDERYRNDLSRCWAEAVRTSRAHGLAELEMLVKCKDGRLRWFVMTAELDHVLSPGMSLLTFHDVHELKASLHQAGQLARTDVVTGLPNRRAAEESLDQALRESHGDERGFSLMLCDVDQFKHINDVYGHDAGDAALRLVADCLNRGIRQQDRVARWGGDEFLLVLPRSSRTTAANIAERLRALVEGQVLHWRGKTISLSVSIGCANTRVHSSREALVAAVDVALYRAKRDGRNRVRVCMLAEDRTGSSRHSMPFM